MSRAKVLAILSAASKRRFMDIGESNRNLADMELVRSRASEPPTVAAVSSAMQPPLGDQDALDVAWAAFHEVVSQLPLDAMQNYRPVLETLSAAEPIEAGAAPSNLVGAAPLRQESKHLLRFMDDPAAVWVPSDKADSIGARSLQERVSTAEQMRPHVPALLDWLADANWPPFPGCRRQLARFPEEAVEPIRALFAKQRGDGAWLLNVLEFVTECVPAGPLWEGLRVEVQAMVDEPQGDEDDCELSDCARRWLAVLDARA
ncbi:hypothetical protein AK830_g2846 [Neonectria ditissima]|uniref:DUF5071 domain-containing protein n=1 Tax=Neonectria ditissima TaxID=78410 RepID=A0A0P7BJ27_9HYPO|nr:hypothetical protein AK830_g2846 [Neonectria ditissima]